MQIPGSGVVRPERDHGAERQVARHGCIVERVADEGGLEIRAEVSVAVSAENIVEMVVIFFAVKRIKAQTLNHLLYNTVRRIQK